MARGWESVGCKTKNMKPNSRPLSPFAEAALQLDETFQEFEQLTSELGRKHIDSDKGLERATEILISLESCGKQLGTRMAQLAQTLDEARQRTELTAQKVTEKAAAVQARRDASNQMGERLQSLGNIAKEITVSLTQLLPPKGTEITDADREKLRAECSTVDRQLTDLLEKVMAFKADAHAAHMESYVRDADWLNQSLQTAHRKLIRVPVSGPN